LKRYVIQETTENRVTFYFRSPREGNYYITVFAQQVSICGLQNSCFFVHFQHVDRVTGQMFNILRHIQRHPRVLWHCWL